MEERRRSVRQKCRLRGRIYFYDGRKSVPCGIRDISYEGARIELLEPIDIPDAIDLYIPQKHRTMHASVRWRHGSRIGVSFSSVLLRRLGWLCCAQWLDTRRVVVRRSGRPGPWAPTQTEPPFAVTRAAVLAIFILIPLIAVIKFQPPKAQM